MEDNLSVLVDAKTEYTKQLTNILVPFIYEGIKSIYEETTEHCKVTDDRAILMRFQEKLSLIPKWSQEMLGQECERIMSSSGCDWLDELVTAVFLSHTKILTAIKKSGKKQKKINLKIPKIDHFIHKCYIECAREFWRNPYLYSDKCSQSEYQRNVRESQKIIGNTIEETIRKLLPVKNILKEYLGEDDDSDKETSFISDSYRDNLRKLVKKEIEICQGKSDMTINGQSDSELITEESENLEKQEDLETIKEIISNELYEKDLTKDNDEDDNVIDMDDIEEISLSTNKVENTNTETTILESSEQLEDNTENLESTNEASVETNEASVETNEASVETNEASVETNEVSLETNKASAETIEETVETNETATEINEASGETIEETVETNETSTEIKEASTETIEETVETNEATAETNESSVETNEAVAENNVIQDSVTETSNESNVMDLNNLNDYSDDEIDVSKLNLKKMDLGSLNVEEINFDSDDLGFDLQPEPLVEINESNSLDEVKKELEKVEDTQESVPTSDNIKKIVIDDGKSSNLKKYTKDVKKNYSFFD